MLAFPRRIGSPGFSALFLLFPSLLLFPTLHVCSVAFDHMCLVIHKIVFGEIPLGRSLVSHSTMENLVGSNPITKNRLETLLSGVINKLVREKEKPKSPHFSLSPLCIESKLQSNTKIFHFLLLSDSDI